MALPLAAVVLAASRAAPLARDHQLELRSRTQSPQQPATTAGSAGVHLVPSPEEPSAAVDTGVRAALELSHERRLAFQWVCENNCAGFVNNGYCSDGGAASDYSNCAEGTDCIDCGPRYLNVPNLFTVTLGPCSVDADGCVVSPNYPSDYDDSGCEIGLWRDTRLSVQDWDTELPGASGCYDYFRLLKVRNMRSVCTLGYAREGACPPARLGRTPPLGPLADYSPLTTPPPPSPPAPISAGGFLRRLHLVPRFRLPGRARRHRAVFVRPPMVR